MPVLRSVPLTNQSKEGSSPNLLSNQKLAKQQAEERKLLMELKKSEEKLIQLKNDKLEKERGLELLLKEYEEYQNLRRENDLLYSEVYFKFTYYFFFFLLLNPLFHFEKITQKLFNFSYN
jgi:hypothetical protein